MNLFWETRQLMQAREDHLTCFIAAALETDASFRAAYEKVVLSSLSADEAVPHIKTVTTQAWFPEHRSQPDMLLVLDDERRVACEHKIEASETVLDSDEGEPSLQLDRHLRLPDVAAVAYFRATIKAPAEAVLTHPRYLRPSSGAPHFVWRDLYGALVAGEQPISAWLRQGFETLSYTPPLPHVGTLACEDDDESRRNQRNFGKLWDHTKAHLFADWKCEHGSPSTLYLTPRAPGMVDQIFVYPLLQNGRLIRARVSIGPGKPPSTVADVRERLEDLRPSLPVPVDVSTGTIPSGCGAR